MKKLHKNSLNQAMDKAVWAVETKILAELFHRATQLGDFMLRYDNFDEAKTALEFYVKTIYALRCPFWVKRDIIFNLTRSLSAPDFDTLCEDIMDQWDEGEVICDEMVSYKIAIDEGRAQSCATGLPEEIRELVDMHHEKMVYYREHQARIDALRSAVDMVDYEDVRKLTFSSVVHFLRKITLRF